MTEYVLGFCFMPLGGKPNAEVVLIRKNKPDWQRGLLNGVGGKIEPGETPHDAMVREWKEETGTSIGRWSPYLIMNFRETRVHVFKAFSLEHIPVRTMTDEDVEIWEVSDLVTHKRKIPNLNWLIPMALHEATPVFTPTIQYP